MREFGYKNTRDERKRWKMAASRARAQRFFAKQREYQARYRAKKRAEKEAAKGSTPPQD